MILGRWLLAGAVLVSSETAAIAARCDPAALLVALDVGHSRASPGATSASGRPEFEYNLALARAVASTLRQAGFPTAMIGAAGTPIRLNDRTRLARDAGAALFLSLHHDSVQPHYLQEGIVDGRTQRFSDRFQGFSLFVSATNPRATASRTFATLLGQALLAGGLAPSMHHAEPIPGEARELLDARLGLYRFDELAVLRTAAMPAVLLEAGVIVHRAEEAEVSSGRLGTRIAAAVGTAVQRYCERSR